MHGTRTSKLLTAAVATALIAGVVVAATASGADEAHDVEPAVVASASALDEEVRTLLAQRASRAVAATEARQEARAAEAAKAAKAERKKKRAAKKRAKAKQRKIRERKQRIRERKQRIRERRALAPKASQVRPGTARAIGKRMARSEGFGSWWQWNCLDALWTAESGWRTSASNSSTGAHGIPQAFPGSKMASHGSDWRTSARTQISWGLSYIDSRWGTPCNAYGHFKRTRWY